ncbi:hypothetical protein [Pseudonocardia sp. Ae505_Ps2]|uniref:hypothetical protein n=1 Tax=Pseudonocardia sp. Ae505_Ps2 TaxID=1885034 RepID=UPI0011152DC3|nr:hypothetical protein [Pseudonocardia sp. Ae505_Ps2]
MSRLTPFGRDAAGQRHWAHGELRAGRHTSVRSATGHAPTRRTPRAARTLPMTVAAVLPAGSVW